ncbi:family FLILHELTA protein [Rutstroemia sp. NJR-2017a WRK4]|nr:family FLILHELTA protein [Rutstroemia sp. NJR-2017a WRK4]
MSHRRHFLRIVPRIPRLPSPQLRFSSSSKTSPASPNPASPLRTRLQTLHNRLPRFLHPYTSPLLSAPKTYIVAFLVLHEITAIIPLFALAGGFHYTGWVPTDLVPREKLEGGVRRFERWFRRRGWFGYGVEGGEVGEGVVDRMIQGEEDGNWRGKRIVLEVATAYAITKVLLPVRIAVSVWGAPWFAGVMGRVARVKRKSG